MTDQLTLEIPAVNLMAPQASEKPQKGPNFYFCFTVSNDGEDGRTKCVRAFTERFGYSPDEVYQELGLVWCGPVR